MPTKQNQLLTAMNANLELMKNSVTKTEVLDAFATLMSFVKGIKDTNSQEFALMKSAISMMGAKLAANNSTDMIATKKEMMDYCMSEMSKMMKEQKNTMSFIYDKVAALQDGEDGETGAVGPQGPAGQDAQPVDEERLIAAILAQIPTPKNGRDGVSRVGWGAHPLAIAQSGAIKEKVARHINFKGTGVSSVVRNPNGTVDVTITGAGGALSVLVATGTIDDSNVIFTFVSAPTIVVVNGASYIDGHGVSIVGTTATLNSPVGTGGHIYGLG